MRLRELTRDRRVHLGVIVADAERGRAAGAIQVPTTRRVVQIASLAAGDSPVHSHWKPMASRYRYVLQWNSATGYAL